MHTSARTDDGGGQDQEPLAAVHVAEATDAGIGDVAVTR